jgi:chemotaxis protein methyltransferase CheR
VSLDLFKSFIKAHLGLHFGPESEDRLQGLLAERMQATGHHQIEAYLRQAGHDPAEMRLLVARLTINETYFYREPQHLSLLTEQLAPALLATVPPGHPVRILSAGCSTGEEPYSIAIALAERFGDQASRLFQITAADLDEEALEHARQGVYGGLSFRALPEKLRERYFTPVDRRHGRISDRIRQAVRIVRWNLVDHASPPEIAPQDVIFFRNVSIYFDTRTREEVFSRLRSLLKPHGYLIVGATETLANDFGLMALQARDDVFLFRRDPTKTGPVAAVGERGLGRTPSEPRSKPLDRSTAGRGATALLQPPSDPARIAARPPPIRSSASAADPTAYARALALTHEERFEEALRLLEPECALPDTSPSALILKSHLLIERGEMAAATESLMLALDREPWSSDGLLLLGHCARLRGDYREAIRVLRRAIYNDPSCWRAHYRLAEAYRGAGMADLAAREYRILLARLERSPFDPAAGSVLPCKLTLKDLRFLCETRLARLSGLVA